jgi:hypothetical protein
MHLLPRVNSANPGSLRGWCSEEEHPSCFPCGAAAATEKKLLGNLIDARLTTVVRVAELGAAIVKVIAPESNPQERVRFLDRVAPKNIAETKPLMLHENETWEVVSGRTNHPINERHKAPSERDQWMPRIARPDAIQIGITMYESSDFWPPLAELVNFSPK